MATRNYDGTFFHLSDGRVETMRIVHRVRGGRVTERLLSLDGSGREFVRNNDELTCYLPDQHTVLVEPRQDRGPFLGSLPQFGADVNEFYRIEALPNARVLGRAARVIVVSPKDQFRFGYRLWLDENTAMPLKTQLCDSRGQVIEQILFARLDMPENIPDSELMPAVRTDGMRWVRQGPAHDSAPPALVGLSSQRIAARISLDGVGCADAGRRHGARPRHLVYSDGLATVSVFVEAQRDGRCRARMTNRARPRSRPCRAWPGRLRLCLFDRRAGPPGDRGGRGSGADGEIIAHSVKSTAASCPPVERRPGPRTVSCCIRAPAAGCARRCWRSSPALPPRRDVPVEVIDVDDDPADRACATATRCRCCCYAGELVCHGHLDAEEVHKALAYHRRPV